MKRLNCLTPFLESGTRFKLPSGETFDQLRQPQPNSTSSTASTCQTIPATCLSTSHPKSDSSTLPCMNTDTPSCNGAPS